MMLLQYRLSFTDPAEKKVKMYCLVRVVHDDIGQLSFDQERKVQLFGTFPDDAVFSCFSGFDLSTGKFPEQCAILAFRSLADQKPVIPPDNGSSDFQQR